MATQRTLAELLGRSDGTGEPRVPTPPAATGASRRVPDDPEPAAARPLAPDDVGHGTRLTLYLHPDDHRALGLAKVDDHVDHNTRLRAMIALWRADPGFRAAVDRAAGAARR